MKLTILTLSSIILGSYQLQAQTPALSIEPSRGEILAQVPNWGRADVASSQSTLEIDSLQTTQLQASTAQAKAKKEPYGQSGKFGIYVGLNGSRFVNEDIKNGSRLGWQAGLYGRSGGTFFGQIGLEYRNSSTRLTLKDERTNLREITGNVNQHFAAIPAYLGLNIGGAIGLRLQAGAELATLISVGKNAFDFDQTDLKRTMVNGLLKAGVDLGPITVDLNYNHGWGNVFKDGGDTKRRIWSLSAGLRF